MARVRRRVAFGLALDFLSSGTPQPDSKTGRSASQYSIPATCSFLKRDERAVQKPWKNVDEQNHLSSQFSRNGDDGDCTPLGPNHHRQRDVYAVASSTGATESTRNVASAKFDVSSQERSISQPTISSLPHRCWFRLTPGSISSGPSVFVLLFFITLLQSLFPSGLSNPQDAEHLTAMVGDSIIFNCHIEFPEAHPVPYVIQWEKKGVEIPIFIWYENYLHTGEGYEGRVSRIAQPQSSSSSSSSSPYGLASLNLTRIRESDQGWYLCLVSFLNRSPRQDNKNATLFHLNVHAPPRFTMTPDDVVYVSLGDPIILSCLAEGTPVPEILWYRDSELVHTTAALVVANDGTELRISSIRQDDIGDYTCTAKNGQGSVRHTTKLVVAGGAVIIVPPMNVTRLEGDKLEMPCEARGLPGNFSVSWYRENHAVRSIPWLESRTLLKRDGTLVISPVHSDDRGLYSCEVTNGIGEPQRASAYIEVEYPARVTFTPTVQYLPLRLSGVVRCHVEAHPPFQFITWTKDKRIFDPFETPNVGVLKNGSLLFEKVTQDNQGRYTCTPYNVHGTAGSSAVMEVLVREPPTFVTMPKPTYLHKIDDNVQMACEAQGTPSPRITWRRMDGRALPRERSREESGVLTINKLHRSDFGYYECHVANEVATLIATAHLVIEGTTPHAPYNITTESTEFSVSLEWLPGYSGGSDYSQNYIILYRQEGATQWIPVDVDPPTSTKTSIHNLQPGTSYEFQVKSKNMLGDGMLSNIVKERTKGQRPPDPPPPGPSRATTSPASSINPENEDNHEFRNYNVIVYPTDARGSTYIPSLFRPTGPPPLPPENVTVAETSDGVILTWSYPRRGNIVIAYFTVDVYYDEQWKRVTKTELKPHENSFIVKNLNAGKTYDFRVNSHTLTSQASSEKVTFIIPRKVKDKAITAGIVGGILFFIVAIILAVCTVKCVNKRNKRRRREQEKAYSMVACQVTDTRNGSQPGPAKSVPSRKGWIGRLPSVTGLSGLKRSIHQVLRPSQQHQQYETGVLSTGDVVDGGKRRRSESTEAADWLEYGAADLQPRGSRRRTPARYSVQAEFLEPSGWISRTEEGKFVVIDDSTRQIHSTGFDYPPGAVVESGVYRIGGDRLVWPRPQPILRRELSPLPPPKPKPPLSPRPHHTYAVPLHPSTLPSSPQFGLHVIPSSQPMLANQKEIVVIRSSSPGPGLMFSPSLANFSDMSSVRQPSSAERSFPSRISSSQYHQTPDSQLEGAREFNRFFPNNVALSPSVSHSRYTRELPALIPIHQQLAVQQSSPRTLSPPQLPPSLQMRTVRAEIHSSETPRSSSSRVQNDFGLLLNTAGRHFHAPPPFRPPPPPPVYQRLPYTISYPPSSQRPLATSSPPRSRHFPVGVHSFARGPDDSSGSSRRRRSPLTIAVRMSPARSQPRLSERNRSQIVEYSPQSQSSSSGFDSKNTSQQNQSSQSGSGHSQFLPDLSSQLATPPIPSRAGLRLPDSTYVNWPVAAATSSLLDASVDNHYEFDTTQSPNETGQDPPPSASIDQGFIPSTSGRAGVETVMDPTFTGSATAGRHRKTSSTPGRPENIEARVQAMKEEFQEYRKRRARGLLESAC